MEAIAALIESLDIDEIGQLEELLRHRREVLGQRGQHVTQQVCSLQNKPGLVPAQDASGSGAVARHSAAETTIPDSCCVVH